MTLSDFITLWPTPNASDHIAKRTMHARGNLTLQGAVAGVNPVDAERLWPTPTANRWDGPQSHGVNVVTGSLNPVWVEWLMGYPAGWTDCEDSETPSSPRSPSTSGN